MRSATAGREIGRDLLPGGRVVRSLAGLLFMTPVAGALLTDAFGPLSWRTFGLLGIAFALAAAGYTALVAILGDRVLVRVDPWLGAIVLYAPLAAILTLPFVPGWAAVGASLFIGVSLLVEAVIGYGGCEIAGIPTLVLRRRYTIYCILNGADVAERVLRHRSRWVAGVLGVVTFVVTIGVYEWVAITISQRAVLLSSWVIYLMFLLAGFAANRALGTRSVLRAAQPS
ncbi:MAG TPA: DUF6410 domain-containing protein [Candidatus Dormibacteraeota bacterium]|nr:DUF6410 domain-containing protein [Candidatus Dormibacteraeota bacterium]